MTASDADHACCDFLTDIREESIYPALGGTSETQAYLVLAAPADLGS